MICIMFFRSICQQCLREAQHGHRKNFGKCSRSHTDELHQLMNSSNAKNCRRTLLSQLFIPRPLPQVLNLRRSFSSFRTTRTVNHFLLHPGSSRNVNSRYFSIGGIVRNVLRIRYIVLGTAVGGGVAISQVR